MNSFYPPLHYHGLPQSVIWELLQTNSSSAELNEPNLFGIRTDSYESLLGTSVSLCPKDFLCAISVWDLNCECFAASDGQTNDALCLRCSSFDFSVSHCVLPENVKIMSIIVIKVIMMLVLVRFSLKGKEHKLFLK